MRLASQANNYSWKRMQWSPIAWRNMRASEAKGDASGNRYCADFGTIGDALPFGERRDLIREVLERIVVKDEGIEMVQKP